MDQSRQGRTSSGGAGPRTVGLRATLALLFAAALGWAAAQAAPCGTSDKVTINFYSGGDVNVQNLWQNDILPAYKAVCPNVTLNLVFSEHGTGDQLTLDRIAAAKQAGKSSGVDLWETGMLDTAGQAGLVDAVSTDTIPNLSKVDPDVVQQIGGYGVPYRGSSVVLAYDSSQVSDPPTTLQGLFDWIKANPGMFTYNPPDTGGSGDNFVQAVLRTGIDQSDLKTFQTGYDQALESEWDPGWQTLDELGKSMYQNGFYPKGNAGVLQLLGKGSIAVAPVWSDMALSYLDQGLLPDTVKLEQLDPPFNGGASYVGVISDSPHKDADNAFLNWLLTPDVQAIVIDKMNGYPGVTWDNVPQDVREKFADIAKSYSFGFSSKFDNDLHQLWYQKVAGAQQQ